MEKFVKLTLSIANINDVASEQYPPPLKYGAYQVMSNSLIAVQPSEYTNTEIRMKDIIGVCGLSVRQQHEFEWRTKTDGPGEFKIYTHIVRFNNNLAT